MSDVAHLMLDFQRAARSASRQARGIVAKGVDAGAAEAKRLARARWTRSGAATGESEGSIRARMSREDETTGYIIVDGGGAYQETGTGHHPPNPVLPDAADVAANVVAGKLPELNDVLARFR